jgi:hypothetical protein
MSISQTAGQRKTVKKESTGADFLREEKRPLRYSKS